MSEAKGAMRGVVTGASGFIGSHVADALTTDGYEVTAFDAQPTARPRAVRGDLLDLPSLRYAFRGAEFVCHLAAVGDVYLAAEKPALAAEVNVVGTAIACEAALAEGVRRFVLASTWEVYGQPRYEPIDELHPCDPDHPYNITKLASERLALAYGHLRGLDVVALRLGTAYGLRMRPNSVFSAFIGRAVAGEPITIHGSGQQTRQFTHARDVARAFGLAVQRGAPGAVYNVVSPRSISIRELAELVTSIVPTSVTFGEARPGDVPSAMVSGARARAELGWEPAVVFEAGVREIIDETRGQMGRLRGDNAKTDVARP